MISYVYGCSYTQENQISGETLFPLFCELLKQSWTYYNGWSREHFQKQFYTACFRNSSLYICSLLLDICLRQCLNIKKWLYKPASFIAEFNYLPQVYAHIHRWDRQLHWLPCTYRPFCLRSYQYVTNHFFMLSQSCDVGYLKTLP